MLVFLKYIRLVNSIVYMLIVHKNEFKLTKKIDSLSIGVFEPV